MPEFLSLVAGLIFPTLASRFAICAPQSSSVSRFAAGAFGFLSQSFGGQLTAIAMMVIGYLVWLLVQ